MSGDGTALALGGTEFLGVHLVEALVAAGWDVTLFNRGVTRPDLFAPRVRLRGDRDGDVSALAGGSWDVVYDLSGFHPDQVDRTAAHLARRCGHYVFVSTVSVYAGFPGADTTEDAPLARLDGPVPAEVDGATYGPLKALCEARVADRFGSWTVVRPTVVVGPHDPSDRFTYCRKPWGDGLRAGLDASSDGGLDLSMMERLEFAPLPQPTGQRMWFPFGTALDAHGGFEPRWWGGPIWNVPERTLFLVLRTTSGEEVARARLDWDFPIDVYPSARALHARPVLEIQYLEVHSAFRCAGVGRNLIERTQAAFPDSQLMALSEGADGFWASLGWSRHRHEEDDGSTDHYQPLYLAP